MTEVPSHYRLRYLAFLNSASLVAWFLALLVRDQFSDLHRGSGANWQLTTGIVVLLSFAVHFALVWASGAQIRWNVIPLGYLITTECFAIFSPTIADFYQLSFLFATIWGLIIVISLLAARNSNIEFSRAIALVPSCAILVPGAADVRAPEIAQRLSVTVWLNLIFILLLITAKRIGSIRHARR